MRHLDLFSGIGGFALAAQTVWGPQHELVGFCDKEPFAQAVLHKHWPSVPIYDDIKTLNGGGIGPVDLITGGFPCQPFSLAGKRKGQGDDRHLWPQMFRVIRETKPQWVIAENVAGILSWGGGVVLDEVYADLASAGYQVLPPLGIPAAGVEASHERHRVWIIAYADFGGHRRHQRAGAAQTPAPRLHLQSDWFENAARLCRVDDGLPAGVDQPKLTQAGHRTKRLEALGNAIVPQVAMTIMQAIKDL